MLVVVAAVVVAVVAVMGVVAAALMAVVVVVMVAPRGVVPVVGPHATREPPQLGQRRCVEKARVGERDRELDRLGADAHLRGRARVVDAAVERGDEQVERCACGRDDVAHKDGLS